MTIPPGTIRYIEDESGLRRRLVWDGSTWISRPGDDRERMLRQQEADLDEPDTLSTREALRRFISREVVRRWGHLGLRALFNETGPRKGLLSNPAMRDQARSLGFGWCRQCWADGLKGHVTMPGEQSPGNAICRAAQAAANRRKRPRA